MLPGDVFFLQCVVQYFPAPDVVSGFDIFIEAFDVDK
jgi:hypothetical protein